MTVVATNDSVGRSLRQTHSAATVFTQNPDTPHLLVVPFDAQLTHAYQNNGGWRPLCFRHVQINNTEHTYSAVSAIGDRQHIAAPGSHHWMPQLLPKVYDYQAGSPRIQAGLIGSIPLLIALAAFSAPPAALMGVLTTCIRPRQWQPHQYQYPAGREFVYPISLRIMLIESRYRRERHGRHNLLRSYEPSRIQRGHVESSTKRRLRSVLQLAFDLWQIGYFGGPSISFSGFSLCTSVDLFRGENTRAA